MSYGFRGCWFYRSRGLIAPIDWGQSIYHPCRAIVTNSSTRRDSGGVLWVSAVGFTGRGGLSRRSTGDNRSTIRVELLSPIALHDAIAEASYGFRGFWFYRSRGLIAPIDWGQSIYHQCRAIVPNSSTRRDSGGVLRFSRLFDAGRSGLSRRSIGDNRSTIRVELLSPIALHDALAAVSYGFRGCWFYRSQWLIAMIDWGQSIYHGSAL